MSEKILKTLQKYIKNPLVQAGVFAVAFTVFCLLLLPGLLLLAAPEPNSSGPSAGERIDAPDTVTVYRTATGTFETIPLEAYVAGVVASEMPASFETEALKAQAVASRTYAVSKAISGAELCDSTHCQVYQSLQELETVKKAAWMMAGWPKVKAAAEDTAGELIYYNGALAGSALFHSSSGGKTENSEDVFASAVPYLRSVDSSYEGDATHRNETSSLTLTEFAAAMKKACPESETGTLKKSNIQITKRNEGGSVAEMKVGDAVFSGSQVRKALSLYSADFDISVKGDTITFTSSGFGHGVGLSQYGANGLAKKGENYIQILTHYYSGTQIY